MLDALCCRLPVLMRWCDIAQGPALTASSHWRESPGRSRNADKSMTCRRCACSCESTRCRKCVAQRESRVSRGSFPAGVEAPVQYGPQLRALAVYLHEYQLVPLARVSELLADLCACEVSEGTVLTWVEFAAERLAPVVAQSADWLSASPLQHADETGVRIAGKRHWLHFNSTRFLTHLAWHARPTSVARHWDQATFSWARHGRSVGEL